MTYVCYKGTRCPCADSSHTQQVLNEPTQVCHNWEIKLSDPSSLEQEQTSLPETASEAANSSASSSASENDSDSEATSAEAPAAADNEDPEHKWYREVYQGDKIPQLTLRAVVMGSLIGGVMSLSNLYVGLKTGWGLGVAITACILSYAIWTTLHTVLPKLFPTQMSILENNCMQSCASSAGYSTGGTMVSAIAAYLLITGHHMSWGVLTLWTFFLAVMGVCMAIPMKRQMINVEQLKFPSGMACAETLRSLHSKGEEAMQKARSLGIAGLCGGLLAAMRDITTTTWGKLNLPWIPSSASFPGLGALTICGKPLAAWTLNFDISGVMIAAGALVGWRIAWSMLLGGFLTYAVLAPWMTSVGAIDINGIAEGSGYRTIVGWSTWTGAAIMVASGLTMFAMQWRTMLRAFSGLGSLFSKKNDDGQHDPMDDIEVPSWWFLVGVGVSGIGAIALLHIVFDVTWWMGVIAVIASFFLALVACRATGESDITPVGAMGKITQLTFGLIAPSSMTTNLMTAGLTAGVAGSSADLLTDLKSGYCLGANPRRQFIAQFLGIFAGTIIVVPAFYLIVPDASVLGSNTWPAPSAQVWEKVARLLADGFSALHPTARWGMAIGCLIGILIPLLEKWFPKHRNIIPSATGVGLAMVIPFYNSLSMFIGAAIATWLEKHKPEINDKYTVPVASGIIAGESMVGVGIALAMAVPGLIQSFFH